VYNTRSTGFSILFLEIHYQSQVKIMVAIYALAANKTMAVNKAMKTKLRKTYQGVDAW
jgi:capsular polysaccharide biosynthesis protein